MELGPSVWFGRLMKTFLSLLTEYFEVLLPDILSVSFDTGNCSGIRHFCVCGGEAFLNNVIM